MENYQKKAKERENSKAKTTKKKSKTKEEKVQKKTTKKEKEKKETKAAKDEKATKEKKETKTEKKATTVCFALQVWTSLEEYHSHWKKADVPR